MNTGQIQIINARNVNKEIQCAICNGDIPGAKENTKDSDPLNQPPKGYATQFLAMVCDSCAGEV